MSLTSDVIKDLTNKVVAHEANIAELTADNAALRKALEEGRRQSSALESRLQEYTTCGVGWLTDRFKQCGDLTCWLYHALESPNPGADLLKRHAEELASERGKTDEAQALVEEGFRDVEKLVTLIAELRQRAEAVEATAARLRAPLEVFARAVPVVDSIPLSDNEPVYVHLDNGRWLVCFVGAFRAAQAALDPPETNRAPTDSAVLDFLQRATQPVEIRRDRPVDTHGKP